MIRLDLRVHPDVLFSYSAHYIELIARVENRGGSPVWAEADIKVPEKLSLGPESALRKGRVRVGIVGSNEFIEKSVRVYSGKYTNPQVYRCGVTLYVYSRDGIIETRMEKGADVRCEPKKEASM